MDRTVSNPFLVGIDFSIYLGVYFNQSPGNAGFVQRHAFEDHWRSFLVVGICRGVRHELSWLLFCQLKFRQSVLNVVVKARPLGPENQVGLLPVLAYHLQCPGKLWSDWWYKLRVENPNSSRIKLSVSATRPGFALPCCRANRFVSTRARRAADSSASSIVPTDNPNMRAPSRASGSLALSRRSFVATRLI